MTLSDAHKALANVLQGLHRFYSQYTAAVHGASQTVSLVFSVLILSIQGLNSITFTCCIAYYVASAWHALFFIPLLHTVQRYYASLHTQTRSRPCALPLRRNWESSLNCIVGTKEATSGTSTQSNGHTNKSTSGGIMMTCNLSMWRYSFYPLDWPVNLLLDSRTRFLRRWLRGRSRWVSWMPSKVFGLHLHSTLLWVFSMVLKLDKPVSFTGLRPYQCCIW